MTGVAARLLTILDAEERVYVRMRDLLQRERECMVRLDAERLETIAREKEELADEGRLVEETRLAVAAELSRELGLGEGRPTLSRLCEALGREAGPLREAHTRLVVLVSVVRELLDANAALAGDSLARIRGTLRLLGRMVPGDAVYEARGVPEPAPGVGQLVRRTA